MSEHCLGVVVHSSDCLGYHRDLQHPTVKVLLVDSDSGLAVEDADGRPALPLMTQPFDFRTAKTMVPRYVASLQPASA